MTARRDRIVWVLQGHREGDNAQARELARQLGYGYVLKPLRYTALHLLPNLLLGASLASLNRKRSAPLRPPWPHLLIAVGKRSVPAALWIRRASGGRTKLVQIGRPRAPPDWFDLVITTPQYGLPDGPNVVEIPLPLALPLRPDGATLDQWNAVFAELPRPWTGILIGGARHPYRFNAQACGQLLKAAEKHSGSFLISTSPRTPPAVTAVLGAYTGRPAYVHRWATRGPNPHQAVLALADRFIVTTDSISMIAEATATEKPVEIFHLPRSSLRLSWNAKQGLGAWLAAKGILTPPRDPAAIRPDSRTDIDTIIQRIERLMERS